MSDTNSLTLRRLIGAGTSNMNSIVGYIDTDYGRIYTVEQKWTYSKDVAPYGFQGLSCIPVGKYNIQKIDSPYSKRSYYFLYNDSSVSIFPTGNKKIRDSYYIKGASKATEIINCIGIGTNINTSSGLPVLLDGSGAEKMLAEHIKKREIKEIIIENI